MRRNDVSRGTETPLHEKVTKSYFDPDACQMWKYFFRVAVLLPTLPTTLLLLKQQSSQAFFVVTMAEIKLFCESCEKKSKEGDLNLNDEDHMQDFADSWCCGQCRYCGKWIWSEEETRRGKRKRTRDPPVGSVLVVVGDRAYQLPSLDDPPLQDIQRLEKDVRHYYMNGKEEKLAKKLALSKIVAIEEWDKLDYCVATSGLQDLRCLSQPAKFFVTIDMSDIEKNK